ncbi:hypothetical protein [Halosolutus gelatinilyticus]|uniref:hypothetical protein n=1 Tax=Halosolutus gelatinilyticus TaxID=2931975 RepID=UPI001FF1206F|nr:hypothetical protein [Halosolutus gelatinilyticus]
MFDRHSTFERTTVLLISRSSELVRITTATVEADDRDVDLHAVEEPAEALAFLGDRESDAGIPQASLVLLDVRDGIGGHEFLEAIANDRRLARIPVVVFGAPVESRRPDGDENRTGSAATASEVRAYYDRHANAYVPVPADREAFDDVLARLVLFWVSTARLPNRDDRVR